MPLLLKQREAQAQEQQAPRSHLRWYFAFLVLSGFCALVYEVVWLRLAMASFGVTTALVSIFLSMFMAGLGLGSWGAGVLTRRTLCGDGQRVLRLYSAVELQMYPLIVIDPPPPPAAPGSSLLYSTEFYDVVKKHLRKDGILQNWLPTNITDSTTLASVTKALMQSFPYVRTFPSFDNAGIHFLASMQPIPVTSSAVLAGRMPSAAVVDFVEWGPGANPKQQFEMVVPREVPLAKLVESNPRVPAIRDDQPINEYYLLRDWFHAYR